MEYRLIRERFEAEMLCEYAAKAALSRRAVAEEECPIRTCFQRDIDRIIHSKAFRRLKHKTQVFLRPEGDHYRTRMTHTFEVSRISRTIARALALNEDLTEAIALGHDLGHTPFGHAGEDALNKICEQGFRHNEQSLRVVDKLEKNGQGLNLCHETRDGILNHSGDSEPFTAEAAVVRLADRVAYINHDLDDAIRAGILSDIPPELAAASSREYSKRLNAFITDILRNSDGGVIRMSPEMYFVMESFRNFMFENVYRNPVAKGEETKVLGILEALYKHFLSHPEKLPEDYLNCGAALAVSVCDYIAGMTDQFALKTFNELFIPGAWRVI